VFGRRKQNAVIEAARVDKPGGKNRPTPRRSEQEALKQRPLVPADRKGAARASREAMRAERAKARAAMLTGDDRYLPVRDKGPVRRFARDVVDARLNAGEFFLVVAMAVVLLTFLRDPVVQLAGTALLWLTVLVCAVDGYLLSRRLRKRLLAKFGPQGLEPGIIRYGVMRAFQIRRTRLPKPMVKRGQHPA
jgi:hypothetical protein